ncbi:uncharacterized protein N7483_005862 [Penicillium malachiteum]|uniref:uncharacterized protein n=1 Tax=Penicillium malachiteum TaxID=1324776 RepID=UPI00254766A8|nr:uncharacterized protein N7483_005862 [Penicillium malachiteum]KAJ5731354.1 hypothetical protein N7483_005862 [Penicillium malachiteum]
MSDPIPSASASADPEASERSLPTNAEDRKAAAALLSLNQNAIGAEASPTGGPSGAEQEALGKAMSRLETSGHQRNDPAAKKVVKIMSADVEFLVDQLEVHKNKATELLRLHDGDVVLAMKAFISPSL